MAVLLKLINPNSYSNRLAYQFQGGGGGGGVLEQLLKYQLGVWEAPRELYGPLYTKSYQRTTSVKISRME